ncbi:hypothetical protein GCM10027570_27730 [Streptomonospora sediminis]
MDDVTAQDALNSVQDVQCRVVDRGASPWWYHPALGVSMAIAVGMGSFSWDLIPYAVIGGGAVVPTVLSALVDRRNGVAINRYGATPESRRSSGGYALALTLLIAVGILLQWGAGLPWAMAASGALVLVLTVICGRRIESRVLADLRQGSA